MTKIVFSHPTARLQSVAFVEGYDEPVGFTLDIRPTGMIVRIELCMDAVNYAKELYLFFKDLFRECCEEEGMVKTAGELRAAWYIVDREKTSELLEKIRDTMGSEWEESFKQSLLRILELVSRIRNPFI
ncbi:hypothetical protein [Archaeoglobus veneficus]|uniref:Uncharacterized protein n=1 Tax=Archaeoglobus veneficus (strain DSM 11195 / SNP6) TaxID=693661 RepID=F2KRY9_ARCVS|nr:hypothetical protein [Archaeoglobus veneficus]AEA46830.1 hypothetical protein Arcve_0815 [Archaeoglobus veneficus SNP6]